VDKDKFIFFTYY